MLRLVPNLRSFVTGPTVVDPFDATWGKRSEEFTPEEYGNYIATSNGVFACVNLRASSLAGLPMKAYKQKADGDLEQITSGTLVDLLHRVNKFWTMSRLWRMTEISLGLWGECFWFLERPGGRGEPKEIWWARPDRVRVKPHPTDYVSGFVLEARATAAQDIEYSPEETIWFRYPNPLDEFEGLSPLAAARLAADSSSGAMQSNMKIFTQGITAGGIISPSEKEIVWSDEQVDAIVAGLEKRFKGVDKAHRWAAFKHQVKAETIGFSPKDAEFLGLLKWTLEDICRAYGVPLDLVGGQRTFENVQGSERALWARTMRPEAEFLAAELTEQLVPMFDGQADLVAFDFSGIEVLQEAEDAKWQRASEQISKGAITVNEWREGEQGLDPVGWGDVWWAPLSLLPVSSAEPASPAEEADAEEDLSELLPGAQGAPTGGSRLLPLGSEEHERMWNRFIRRSSAHEKMFSRVVVDLFERQRESVLSKLGERGKRDLKDIADNPFSKPQWVRTFRTTARAPLLEIVTAAGQDALEDLGLDKAFSAATQEVQRFLEQRAQRFAKEVNDTTWRELKASLNEGIGAGEGIPELSARVVDVMEGRIASTPETIARTETLAAANGATLEAWEQSEVVEGKEWLCVSGETRVSGLGVSCAARRWYDGRMVKLTTMAGRVLTITAQHPVLTRHGWIAAEEVCKGDDLICDQADVEGATPHAGLIPDIDHMPTEIAETFNTLLNIVSSVGMVHRVVYLDGNGRKSEIEVVPVHRNLAAGLEPMYSQSIRQLALEFTDVRLGEFFAERITNASLVAHAPASIDAFGGGNPLPNRLDAFSAGTQFAGLGEGSRRFACEPQAFEDAWLGALPLPCESSGRASLPIFLSYDPCVDVKIFASSCHVYDYTTETGWMIANGLVVHNSALDERTRETHVAAHQRYQGNPIPLDEDFEVGAGSGPAPGQIDRPEESINCRCVMTSALKERIGKPARQAKGTQIRAPEASPAPAPIVIEVVTGRENGKPRRTRKRIERDERGLPTVIDEEQLD